MAAIYLGTRQAEFWRLRRSDIDLAGGEFIVREGRDGSTKAGKVRRVPLLPAAHDLLVEWFKSNPQIGSNGFVFPKNDDGDPYDTDHDAGWNDKRERHPVGSLGGLIKRGAVLVQKEPKNGVVLVSWPGLRTRAGIDRDVRYHDLRHTCASHLVQGSWGRAWRLRRSATTWVTARSR